MGTSTLKGAEPRFVLFILTLYKPKPEMLFFQLAEITGSGLSPLPHRPDQIFSFEIQLKKDRQIERFRS